jgi:hypothetical protein
MTDSSTGISGRKRTAVFRGLATGRIVDLLHYQLVRERFLRWGDYPRSI